jgi:hypothetical protein
MRLAVEPDVEAVARRIKISLSASASKVKLLIVFSAPVKAGAADEVAFALAALKVRSALVPKVTLELQLVFVPKFPEVAPVQVWAWSELAWKLRARKTARPACEYLVRILSPPSHFLIIGSLDLSDSLFSLFSAETQANGLENTNGFVLSTISSIVDQAVKASEECEGVDMISRLKITIQSFVF